MSPVKTPKREDGGLQYFQWRHQRDRMKDSSVSSGDSEERGWRTSIFALDYTMREDEGYKCFQWRHQRERMENFNVSSGDTEESG